MLNLFIDLIIFLETFLIRVWMIVIFYQSSISYILRNTERKIKISNQKNQNRFSSSSLIFLRLVDSMFTSCRKLFSGKAQRNIPQNHWNSYQNKKAFIKWLENTLGFHHMNDWYRITSKCIVDNGGEDLLNQYQGSSIKLLQEVFPNHPWLPWKFSQLSRSHWDELEHQKEFLDWLGTELGFKEKEDWYSITESAIRKYGGRALLSKHKDSPSNILQSVYPGRVSSFYQFKIVDHPWKPWKFSRLPSGYWESQIQGDNLLEFMEWLGKQLKVNRLEDWYGITYKSIMEVVPLTLFRKLPLEKVLYGTYPNHAWNLSRFQFRSGSVKISPSRVWSVGRPSMNQKGQIISFACLDMRECPFQ